MNNLAKKKLMPELRFEEFDGEWVRYTIKDVSDKVTDGTHDTPQKSLQGVPYLTAVHVRDGFLDFDNCCFLSEVEHKKIFSRCNPEKGDLLIVNIGAGTATAALVNVDFEFSLKNVALVKPNKEKIDSVFFSEIQRKNSAKLRHQLTSGGAQPFLSLKEIGKLKLIISKDIKEQQKIANFLASVDQRISLLKQKKAVLETYKKGLLQKIFSQEIRFKDENGEDYPDWEEKRLGDVADIKRGASPRPISDPKWFDSESNIGWVRISDVTKTKKYLKETVQYLSQEGVEKSRYIPSGSMIMSICATIGKPVITMIDTCIHDGFVVFDNLNANKEYMFYLLEKIETRWKRYGQPGIQLNLNTSIVSGELVSIPCKEEQQKIADCLSSMDKSINKLKNQIKQTTQFKKGLLQRMFV